MRVDPHLITDYFTGRSVLFTLYTSDFKYISEPCHLQMFLNDTAIVVCSRDGQVGEPGGGICEEVQMKPSAVEHLQDRKDLYISFFLGQPVWLAAKDLPL